jgi:hypothetical protein
MSHLTCPKCGSTEHTQGYGLAAGPMGAYTFCDGCDTMLEFCPDLEGLPEDLAKSILLEVARWHTEVWGSGSSADLKP